MQNLVDYVGINRASLYDTFGNKRQLFENAIRNYKDQNHQFISAYLAVEFSLVPGLRGLFYGAVEMALGDADCKGCMVVNTTAELLPGDPEILGFLRENQRDFESIFVQFLTWAKERGELNSSANVEASALYL